MAAYTFEWREAAHPDKIGQTVWSIFSGSTRYFEPGKVSFMINYRVDNLDNVLAQLKEEGVEVDDRIEEYEYGRRFAWIMDPEGNRIELWEPGEPFTKEPRKVDADVL